MKTKIIVPKLSGLKKSTNDKKDLQGYPIYPSSDDIYNKYQKEREINPENHSENKEFIVKNKVGATNEKGFNVDVSGDDLDIPGSELDDQQEIIGSEDEENNYYSIGGDDHNDLEEDRGV